MKRILPCLLAGALCGCPPGDGGTQKASPSAVSSASSPGQDPDADAASPADPLAGSLFSKDELFAIYRAYQQPDGPARREVLRKHRLVDANGKENATRVKAYDQALETYAQRDPEGWADFVESLPQ